jgi:hypothetical protein
MRPEEKHVISKTQSEAGILKRGLKEILFKEAYEHDGIGMGHAYTHGGYLDLKVMLGVKGEIVENEDELSKLYGKEWGGTMFVKEVFQ